MARDLRRIGVGPAPGSREIQRIFFSEIASWISLENVRKSFFFKWLSLFQGA